MYSFESRRSLTARGSSIHRRRPLAGAQPVSFPYDEGTDKLPADARFIDRWCFMAKEAVCTVIDKYDPQARGRELELVSSLL